MPPLLLLAAATSALLSAAQPTSRLVSFTDYPKDLASKNAQGIVIFRVTVTPDGKPENCTIVTSTGDKGFEPIPCTKAMRSTFTPARDQQGAAIYGVYTGITAFTMPQPGVVPPRLSIPPKMVVEIRKTPATPADIDVAVNVLADAEGKLTACTSKSEDPASPAFVRAACDQLSANWTPSPVRNAKDEAVPAVLIAVVRFMPKE